MKLDGDTRSDDVAAQARALAGNGLHSQVVDLVTQALEAGGSPSLAVRLDLLDARSRSHEALGRLDLAADDASVMLELAQADGAPAFLAQALNAVSQVHLRQVNGLAGLEAATAAVEQARKAGLPGLLATSLFRLSESEWRTAGFEAALVTGREAVALYESVGDGAGAGRARCSLANAYSLLGRAAEAQEETLTALDLGEKAGDSEVIVISLNILSILDTDMEDRIQHLQRALRACEASGNLNIATVPQANLAGAYLDLGLYPQSRRLSAELVASIGSMGGKYGAAWPMTNVISSELALGEVEAARAHLVDLADLSQDLHDQIIDAYLAYARGDLALASGDFRQAVLHHAEAERISREAGLATLEPGYLAYLSRAQLAAGDVAAALESAAAAADLHRAQEFAKPEGISCQEIWWRYAQALRAVGRTGEAIAVQARAYQFLLEAIAQVRDEGLRRSYLNKVESNRELLEAHAGTWTGPDAMPHLLIESNIRDPFKRLADTGLRLNALRTSADIIVFMVEEATALCGGERVAVVLEKDGRRTLAGAFLPRGESGEALLPALDADLDRARLKRAALLEVPAASGASGGVASGSSRLTAPLVARNQVIGYIHADLGALYGAFNEADRDMLGLLASQAAVALDNARWAEGLEEKVEERTLELQAANLNLEQRNTELAIINDIQRGLASKLDFQDIVDLVGDKLRQDFHTPDLAITWFDAQANLMRCLYLYEHAVRIFPPPYPPMPDGPFMRMTKTLEPLVWNTAAEGDAISTVVPGTDQSKSGAAIPIISGDRVIGGINIENYERERAFSASDISLMMTVAGALGAALENAQLFSETQRLLKETEQRNQELAIINSVQAALASKLDTQAIYALMGEKAREVFNVAVVDIVTFDPATGLLSMPYSYEKGDRSVITPREPYGFRRQVMDSREPLLINRDFAELAARAGNPVLTGACPKSALFVPFLAEGEVTGIISIQDLDAEDAISASDVRLLQTLANAMSIALENARLFDETQRLLQETERRNRELATVNTVSKELAGELEVRALIRLVGEQVRTVFKADIAYVALLDEATHMIEFPYTQGEEYTPLRLGEGLTSEIIQSGQPRLINRVADQNLAAPMLGKAVQSYLGVPILVGSQPAGVISVQYLEKENAFGPDDERLLNTLAVYVGTALQNARLFNEAQAARAAAEKANQAKSAFLASMSHELRTPLNAILGFAQILERDAGLSARQAEQVRTINRSGSHLLKLINDVLDMSKIEARQMSLKPAAFCLADLIDDLEMMFKARTDAKQLRLLVERNESVPRYVIADEGKLRQIMINLIGNAVKFTEAGGVAVRMRAEADASSGPGMIRLGVEVEDTGPGIPAEDQDRIFDAFQQAGAGATFGGTGLGLSISKKLIEMMGGTLSVVSQVGRGSCFRFEVLLEQTDHGTEYRKPATRRVVGLQAGSEPYRILVVDDVSTNRAVIRELLEPLGFEIREAADGAGALAAFDRWSPHLILMDMRMPVMDGYEATRRLKATPAGRATPVIGVTASAFEEDEQKILDAGVEGYLRKPFRPEDLFQILEKQLGLKYTYADEPGETVVSPPPPPAEERLAPLSPDLAEDLRQAVDEGDISRLTEILDRVEAVNSRLARELKGLADTYDYDAILARLGKGMVANG